MAVEGLELVATVGGAREAVRAAVMEKPDVLVLDINMPDGSGIEVAHELQRVAPDVAIVMLTMHDDDSVFAAMRAGARGYVLKGADPEEVVRAITAVASGSVILGAGVASRALAILNRPGREEPAFPQLTSREREVLDLIAQGLGNATIAGTISVSPSTVGNHVTSIFAKMQVASRSEAIVRARDAGLGSL